MGYYNRPKPVRASLYASDASRYIYQLVHASHFDHLAWHPELGWTQSWNGKLYTHDEANHEEDLRQMTHHERQAIIARSPGSKWVPNEAVWCIVGLHIQLHDRPVS